MNLRLSRLRNADRLVGGGAIALFIFVFFFNWFGESVSGTLPASNLSGVGNSSSGWDTFTDSRWIWLLTIVVAIASVLAIAGGTRLHTSLQPGAVVLLLGALSSVLILYRIVHHPVASAGFGGFHASYGIKFGIWLGLIAALAIAGGGYLQLRAEHPAATAADVPPENAFSGLTAVGDAAPPPPARADDSSPPSPRDPR
jgi:hypothetical protein